MKFRSDVAVSSGMDSKNFVKLADKGSIQGVFRGDPYEFRVHWVDRAAFPCAGADCELCKKGSKSGFRFRLNFVVREEGKLVAKIFEQGAIVYETLRQLHEGDYNLESTFVKITRYGMEKDTTYSILPIKEHAVDPKAEKLIQAVELLPLDYDAAKKEAPKNAAADEPFGGATSFTDDDLPF